MFWGVVLGEPQWGYDILLWLNTVLAENDMIASIVTLLSDVFVFLYPVFLVAMFLYGIKYARSDRREMSLVIFLSACAAYLLNFVIKTIFAKERPDVLLDLPWSDRSTLVLSRLPESTFPSDHAGVSMAFGVAILLIGLSKKNGHMIASGIFFVLVSLVMGTSRIAIGVHRPTDIIAGRVTGIVMALVVRHDVVYAWLSTHIINPLVLIQQRLWRMFGR